MFYFYLSSFFIIYIFMRKYFSTTISHTSRIPTHSTHPILDDHHVRIIHRSTLQIKVLHQMEPLFFNHLQFFPHPAHSPRRLPHNFQHLQLLPLNLFQLIFLALLQYHRALSLCNIPTLGKQLRQR